MFEQVNINREVIGAGENLLVCGNVMALPQEIRDLAGKAQCVYLDPPFMTGEKFMRRRPYGEQGWKTGTPAPRYPAYEDRYTGEKEYLRLLRPASETGDTLSFDSAAETAYWLSEREGRVLLTTGAKELSAFAALDPERLIPRVLPSHESLAACEALGIPHRNIIAMQGPFSQELNAAMIRQFGVRYLVSKDGGGPGGFPEKAAAAKETGTQLIVLRRPEESGLPFDAVLNLCITRLRAANLNETKKGETT